MIIYVILEMIDSITEQFKGMKSNIINIQEQENNSEYKLEFWNSVVTIMLSTFLIITVVALFLVVVIVISTSIGLKALLSIIVVGVAIYAMFKTEVFYKLLYKLFKKNDKEES